MPPRTSRSEQIRKPTSNWEADLLSEGWRKIGRRFGSIPTPETFRAEENHRRADDESDQRTAYERLRNPAEALLTGVAYPFLRKTLTVLEAGEQRDKRREAAPGAGGMLHRRES